MISTKLIKLENIEVGARLRDLRLDMVDEIAKSIRKGVGVLLQPIVIRPKPKGGGYLLVVGRHRLEAERKLGNKTIECRIVEMDDDQAMLAEIDENLVRADLTKKEIDYHIVERKKLYEKLHPQAKQGGAPGKAGGGKKARTDEERQQVSSFAEDTAKKTAVSKRTVQRAVARAKAGDTAAEPKTSKPKKKVTAPPAPPTEPVDNTTTKPNGKTGNSGDPDETAAQMKAAHAANEGNEEQAADIAVKPKPAPSKSAKALAEFKIACDHWLPLLNKDDLAKAVVHANGVYRTVKLKTVDVPETPPVPERPPVDKPVDHVEPADTAAPEVAVQ
jgi:ParB family transcriptional regulator, chromosome partitioning protein